MAEETKPVQVGLYRGILYKGKHQAPGTIIEVSPTFARWCDQCGKGVMLDHPRLSEDETESRVKKFKAYQAELEKKAKPAKGRVAS